MRLILINPNTDTATTRTMLAIASAAAPAGVTIEGVTAPFGAPLIADEGALATAAEAVAAVAAGLDARGTGGIIVAAFGDPGADLIRGRLRVPVTGIAEAGMAEAAAGGRLFAVVTTTPALEGSIRRKAEAYGHAARLCGVRFARGERDLLMADPRRLEAALAEACERAIAEDRAEALVIGGGPLAAAARALRSRFPVPIIEPVPSAVRLAVQRAR